MLLEVFFKNAVLKCFTKFTGNLEFCEILAKQLFCYEAVQIVYTISLYILSWKAIHLADALTIKYNFILLQFTFSSVIMLLPFYF